MTVREVRRIIQRFSITPAGTAALEDGRRADFSSDGNGLRTPAEIRARMAAAVELLADSLANDDQAIPVIRLAMLELKGAIPLREWAELSKDLRGAGVALSSSGVHMPPVTEWRDVPRIIELLIELIRTAAASGSFPALTPP